MTAASRPSAFHCLTYALLILPPLLLTSYFLAAFPNRPESIQVSPSLASLPKQAKSWSVYPEDIYGEGGYARFPYGKVRLDVAVFNDLKKLRDPDNDFSNFGHLGQVLDVGPRRR